MGTSMGVLRADKQGEGEGEREGERERTNEGKHSC